MGELFKEKGMQILYFNYKIKQSYSHKVCNNKFVASDLGKIHHANFPSYTHIYINLYLQQKVKRGEK